MEKKETNFLRLIAIAVVGILVIAAALLFLTRDPCDYTQLKNVSISYRGTMSPTSEEYRLEKTDGSWNATYVKRKSFTDDSKNETVSFEPDPVSVQRFIDVLKSKKVGKWDGYNKSLSFMTDGTYYYFNAAFFNGKKIDAQGYMSSPKGYNDVWDAFSELFETQMQNP